MTLSALLGELDEDAWTQYGINFNSYTDAAHLQFMLEQPLEKKTGSLFGPPGTKRLVYFVDDLNMSTPDKYGTQPPIELLRQQLDYGGFFDLKKLSMKTLTNVQYVATLNPSAGSFSVADRLQRHFATLATPFPDMAVLKHIYTSIMGGHLEVFEQPVRDALGSIVDAACAVHQAVADEFLPTAVKFHYQWNLRAMASVFQGLTRMRPAPRFSTALQMARLWSHETKRVYGDRMVDEKDVSRFESIMVRETGAHLGALEQKDLHAEPNLFGSFVDEDEGAQRDSD